MRCVIPECGRETNPTIGLEKDPAVKARMEKGECWFCATGQKPMSVRRGEPLGLSEETKRGFTES